MSDSDPPRGLRTRRAVLGWLAIAAVALATAACPAVDVRRPEEAGDDVSVQRGEELITTYGCGTCHTIPGIRGADALVGPPLTHFSERTYIAGSLTNTPENLAHWIANPQEVEPNTAMPDLGVPLDQAEDIAAYLHSLD